MIVVTWNHYCKYLVSPILCAYSTSFSVDNWRLPSSLFLLIYFYFYFYWCPGSGRSVIVKVYLQYLVFVLQSMTCRAYVTGSE